MSRSPRDEEWNFEYAPVPTGAGDDDGAAVALVVATSTSASPSALLEASGATDVAAVFDHAPIHWYRLLFDAPVLRADIRERLLSSGVDVRYVASFQRASTALGKPMEAISPNIQTNNWKTRSTPVASRGDGDGQWFLGPGSGIDAGRSFISDGAGTRLAVIDDDAMSAEELDLDAEIAVGISSVPRSQTHGALMVAWAVGSRGARPMAGVAPAASPRLYVIPKPGREVLSLAVALARAVLDGADVVICATYAESSNSPMLDDALNLAVRFGRDGRGTPVVFPTGREASSPAHAIHASWSLSLADPACDARVFCIAPGAREGGWFVWKDRRGVWHPFANRGPEVRWTAPGDDVSYPFGPRERLCHAESSGASAIAAGVLLRVIGSNPTLHVGEVEAIVTRTTTEVSHGERERLHPSDAAPLGNDADGHNAKHGYGRMNAFRACASALDPIAAALVDIGEDDSADRWLALRSEHSDVASAYSKALSLWMARAFAADASFAHSLRTLVRHLRLLDVRHERVGAQITGAVLRHMVLVLEGALFSRSAPTLERRLCHEVEAVRDELIALGNSKSATLDLEEAIQRVASIVFSRAGIALERESGTRLREASRENAEHHDSEPERESDDNVARLSKGLISA